MITRSRVLLQKKHIAFALENKVNFFVVYYFRGYVQCGSHHRVHTEWQ
jgi:hypothetical protein